jgi:hypothetical protein
MILTVPSYVIPGTYGENLRFLADKEKIRGVELLFFYYDGETRSLFDREREEIESYRGRFRYTLHLPDTVLPSHREFVRATRPLADHYVLHPPRDGRAPALESFIPGWIEEFGNVFLLENTRFNLFNRALSGLPNIPVCCDVGHLLLEGTEPARFLDLYGGRIGEIHLHGIENGVDHNGFDGDEPWFRDIAPFLRTFPGVLNLEVFSFPAVQRVLKGLASLGLSGEKGPSF